MSTVLTEGRHPGEFILSEEDEGNLSRDNITLASGQNLVAGTVLSDMGDGTWEAYTNSGGATAAAGILYADTDATNGAVDCVAITRHAEVIGDALTWTTGSPADADTIAGVADLKALGIIVR